MYAKQFKWQVRAGAGQGTSSTETSISMAALHWRREGRREGGRMADSGRRQGQKRLSA